MKKVIMSSLLLIGICIYTSAQSLYDPQQLYDAPGGLFDKDILGTIDIDFEDPNYHSILVDAFFSNPSYRIPATVTMNGEVLDSVGVRYKGNSTFCLPNDQGNPKLPYNLDMNYWISGQKLMGYKKVKLANSWLDPTFVKEFSAAQIYRNYLPSPEVNLVQLNVQGNYLGLYVNTESVNKQFLEKHYDEKSGVLFKCDGAGVFCGNTSGGEPALRWLDADSTSYYDSYTIKSDYGWAQLLELINTLNFNPEELENILNVDRVLWAFAVNTAISNLDTYNGYYVHNYYLYQTEDGLFQMIPWDLSESFLGAIMGWDYWNPQPLYEYDPYFGEDVQNRPLTYYLFNHPLYRKQYTAHLRTVIEESLDTAIIRGKIDVLQSLAYDAVDNDFNKPFTMGHYTDNVEEALWTGWGFGGILSTIDPRKEFLLSHPEISLAPPTLENISVSNNIITVSANNETIVDLMATNSPYNSKFQAFPMYDDGTNGDALAADGIYSAPLPFSSSETTKFYIRAQNDDALSVLPKRAAYEFYEYSLATSVQQTEELAKTNLFPNPASDHVYIAIKDGAEHPYQLFTLTGQIVLSGQTRSSLHRLDIADIQQGVYILKVGDEIHKVFKTNP